MSNNFKFYWNLLACGMLWSQVGLYSDNYSGILGLEDNPTHFLNGPINAELHLGSLHAEGYTNYARIGSLFDDKPTYKYHDTSAPVWGSAWANIHFPAYAQRTKDTNAAWGVFIKQRTEFSFRNSDGSWNNDVWETSDVNFYANASPRIAGVTFTEIGYNFAQFYSRSKDLQQSIGGNLKLGLAEYASMIRGDYNIAFSQNSTDVSINGDGSIKAGESNGSAIIKGISLAADLGYSVLKLKNPEFILHKDQAYDWKLNISLLDFGSSIHYGKVYDATLNGSVLIDQDSLEIAPIARALGVNTSEDISGIFTIGMPTRLNVNFDYNIRGPWYIQGRLVQRFPFFLNTLRRANAFHITPRYESKNFTVGLPLGFREYAIPNLGTYIRYRAFYIGSDNLLPLLTKKLNGTNIYLGVKVPINPKEKSIYRIKQMPKMNPSCECADDNLLNLKRR